MLYPKQKDQHKFMGKRCIFTHEFFRNVTKKRHVKWCKQKISHNKLKTGWITGFGCTYNGSFKKPSYDFNFNENTYFSPNKRIVHIKVRTTPEGKELKIALSGFKVIE